jgi:hypothetical protein
VTLKWYKHDPSAALAGMIGLTVEERGAYYTLIDLQYARAPHSDVTDELVIKALAIHPQFWRRLKAGLIAKGKLRETGGKLTANRVENQVKTAIKRGLLGGPIEENQPLSGRVGDQSGTTESKESRIETSSFPTAARESAKRKKKEAEKQTVRSLASALPSGALPREPKISASLEQIIKAKGWKQ